MKLKVIKQRYFWWTVSAFAFVLSLLAMIISYTQFDAPLRPSIDFVGGTRLQLEQDCSIPNNCDQPIEVNQVREILTEQGFPEASIQVVGEARQGLSIRTRNLDVDERTQLQSALTEAVGQFDPKTTKIDTVGPTIGQELFTSGILALLVSFFGIIVYLSIRFRLDYAVFAIFALFHDALITSGVFAILGLVAGVEVDSLFLVALLTIIGFSVNDTVVIYDRIRETRQMEPEVDMNQVVDDAVNQTLTRSINTTLTTVLPLLAILLFGGDTLKEFALALIIGFILGAYSSIFLASTLLAWWEERQATPEPEPSNEQV
ncbi:MAG: protein translocase subunit SecF [Cyanobacteria bacterium]|jgi:preprotein translocase subunit SecF|nr:protein translocase subunit SecF [Cyanobacteria bacterium GSL.Bin1]